jgi:23S rRNA (guanine2445-N2)-methyltransferase / 23S rRNA (guanine2069-N7)-methyltransferase
MTNVSIAGLELTWFISCPKGLEPLLLDEITALGAAQAKSTVAGVHARGTLQQGYRWCLWSRLANRVLLVLGETAATSADDLYDATRAIDWSAHFDCDQSFAINFVGGADWLRHTHFGALKVKDAIADQFREREGRRPDVDARDADIRIQATLRRGRLSIALDFSGDSLHRRGYRLEGAKAPLKENLAAALLLRAGWPELAQQGQPLVDGFCGSGTLVIEAALMAGDVAPGLLRDAHGFERWRQHDHATWQALRDEADQRRTQRLKSPLPVLLGLDADDRAIAAARANAARAGVAQHCDFRHCSLAEWTARLLPQGNAGLFIANPPHGERLGDVPVLIPLYEKLGQNLKQFLPHWRAAVFTPDAALAQSMRLRSDKRYQFYNGAIETVLWCYWEIPQEDISAAVVVDEGIESFSNRLKKNIRQFDKWAKGNGISCYRIYDADIPEYAVAVDRYGEWVQITEYAAPKTVDAVKAHRRLQAVFRAVPEVLAIPADRVVIKQRMRQKGSSQYQRQSDTQRFITVTEGQVSVQVNLWDYLDTGLFLDHRPIRLRIAEWARDRHFLNLFCYTAVASLHAAAGGAASTTSVDMSATYLDWARRNFALNGISGDRHRFIQQDCLKWLEQSRDRYDLVFMDPPTFSNSKRMDDTLDIQRDHIWLIDNAMRLLTHQGLLIFSNNLRRFRLDPLIAERYAVEDYTKKSLDKDFERNPRIHQCFLIRHKSDLRK